MTGVSRKKRQLNTSRGKTGNAGFSLIELLIAVTILAIIVIPLLHMFVTSTKVNVKSRQTLRATTVAQDIMEGLKAYTLDDVRTQFSLPDGRISDDYFYPTEGFYIINSKMIEGGIREIRELETDRDEWGNLADEDNSDNEIYYFGIEKLKMQGSEYDALIKLDASTYGAGSQERAANEGTTPAAGAHDKDFNGMYYADATSVAESSGNSDVDSSYHEHKDLRGGVLSDVKSQMKDDIDDDGAALPDDWDSLTLEDLVEKRNITVTIEDAGSTDSAGNPECKATITFEYICKDKYGHCKNASGKYISYGLVGSPAGVVGNPSDPDSTITRTFSSGNFYLFYYPLYTGAPTDNILFEIKNASTLLDADAPMLKSITLAKQIRSTVDTTNNTIEPELSDNRLRELENTYKVTVDLLADGTMASDLVFRSNVDMNMAQKPLKADGSIDWDRVYLSPANINLLIMGYSNVSKVDLGGEEVSDRITNVIYDIEITVYKTGAAQYFEYYEHFDDPGFAHKDEVQKLATITNLG